METEDGFPPVDAEKLWPEERTSVVTAGDCRIYTERLRGRKKLVVCEAGHVSLCVLPIARMLGFEICVLEDREMFADKAKKAGADRVLVGDFGDLLREMPDDGDTGYLVLTRGHRFDMECLKEILWRKNRTYVGMMCSRSRAEEARARMRSEGFSEEALAPLHAPVGLRIGARTPEEIAVSIMAEIISETGKREAVEIPEEVLGALREKKKCVLAQIISRRGSAPRDAGTKMVIFADGMTAVIIAVIARTPARARLALFFLVVAVAFMVISPFHIKNLDFCVRVISGCPPGRILICEGFLLFPPAVTPV